MTTAITLADNLSASGQWYDWPGGSGVFVARATWGGGTVKLQFSMDGGTTAVDVGTYTTLTANGGGNFTLPACKIRANIATATAVYATAQAL